MLALGAAFIVTARHATDFERIEVSAERLTVENTKRICPGVYVAGMSANAAFGGPRMGPIFGGMLLSGKKVADLIAAGDE